MSYKSSLKNWEGLAKEDPLWSICTNPDMKGNRWDMDAFFDTGKMEVDTLWTLLQNHNAVPDDIEIAIDFGCGIGRLSRALTPYFDQVIGIDAAPSMIAQAKESNIDYKAKLDFKTNELTSLPIVEDNSISFIMSMIVLQHIPTVQSQEFVGSFIKKLKSGGILLIQVPSKDIRKPNLIQRIKSTIKIKERLAQVGIGKGFNMSMNCISEDSIQNITEQENAVILKTLYTNHTEPEYNGKLKIMAKEDSVDFVSNLYLIKKN